jgi:hypothetical protein
LFLAIQVLLLLFGAGASVKSVRLGVVVWLALTTQFMSFMWMTVPVPHFAIQAAVFGGIALIAGAAMAMKQSSLPWWALSCTNLLVLGLLRLAMMFYWLAGAPISRVSMESLRSSTVALCVPTTLALLLASVVGAATHRSTKAA